MLASSWGSVLRQKENKNGIGSLFLFIGGTASSGYCKELHTSTVYLFDIPNFLRKSLQYSNNVLNSVNFNAEI